jgi:homoserine O-acetyltransferase
MDWQTAADSVPSGFITESNIRSLLGKPPATGAWRDGDPVGGRLFARLGSQQLEFGAELPAVRVAFESWGTLNADASNAVLILHALTGDSHVVGTAGPGHQTSG